MITHPILTAFILSLVAIACLLGALYVERLMMWWNSFGVSPRLDTHKRHRHLYTVGVSWSRNGWWLVDDDMKWECRMFEIKIHLLQHIVLIDLPSWPRRSPLAK